jgi:lipoprotein-anchoring transpeptidase ErfK/SrfK
VATALGPLTVFHKVSGRPYERLSRRTKFGSPRVLLVTAVRPGWVRALLPERPNGAQGWVPASQVVVAPTAYRVEVSRRAHRLAVFRNDRLLLRAPVVTGAAGTPTPFGIFFVTDVLPVGADQPAYGPWALALSGYSPTLATFAGGDAEVALHGTNEPWLLGRSASHGCIRMGNAVVTRLAHLLPLGTPVVVS